MKRDAEIVMSLLYLREKNDVSTIPLINMEVPFK